MRIFLHNKEIIIENSCTLSEFFKSQEIISGNYAVAVNKKFIAKADYAHTVLNHQDQITIIRPMQGG